VRVAGAELLVREWGDEDAPAVVFWHGLGHAGPWQATAPGPIWAARGLRVLAPSAPGWETPPLAAEGYRPSALALVVEALLDELELERAAFVGFSWGASIGVHLAACSPGRLESLALLDAGYTDAQDEPGYVERSLAKLVELHRGRAPSFRFESWDAYLNAMHERARIWRPHLEERLRSAMHEQDGAVVPRVSPEVVAAAAWGEAAEPPSEVLAALGELEVPVLLVVARTTAGSPSGLRALDRFRAAAPAAEVREIDSRHDLLADAPAETIRLVGDWLARPGGATVRLRPG
jgi:pimeloyl-ACP methyl ester carboxylesterase